MCNLKEIEREFFITFDIKGTKCVHHGMHCWNPGCPRYDDHCEDCESWCRYVEFNYSQESISDRRYLELLCAITEWTTEITTAENVEDLKKEILQICIKEVTEYRVNEDGDDFVNDRLYEKVQELFKGEPDE